MRSKEAASGRFCRGKNNKTEFRDIFTGGQKYEPDS